MAHSNLNIGCNVTIREWDGATGALLRTIRTRNLFVLSGRNKVRDLMLWPDIAGDGFTPDYIALGSSGTTTTDSMTTLGGEVFRKLITRRVPLASSWKIYLRVETSECNGGGTQELREVGLFTESSGGTLWARATHALISKTAAIALTYEWEFIETAS